MQKPFKPAHTVHNQRRWWRNEYCVSRPCATDPVLTPAKFAGLFVAASTSRQQDLVNFPDEPQRERKSFPQSLQTLVHRCDIVRDFLHILNRYPRGFLVLKEKEIRKRRLRAFDLRREYRLFADIGIDKKRKIGKHGRKSVEATEGLIGLFKEELQAIEPYLRDWRKRRGYERTD